MNSHASRVRRERRLAPALEKKASKPHVKPEPPCRAPDEFPDPWLYRTSDLISDLDAIRELILRVPISQKAFGPIQVALCAVWELRQRLQWLAAAQRDMQREFRTLSEGAEPTPRPTRETDTAKRAAIS